MSDIEQRSLGYFLGHGNAAQWKGFLSVLADELNSQMPPVELRAFFRVLGRRLAEKMPLTSSLSVADLEQRCNERLEADGWGWVTIRDHGEGLDILHSCAPLRSAFGGTSIGWSSALLEGLHAGWMKQAGAGDALEVRQVGEVAGSSDTVHFRLAHPSLFA